MDPYAVLMKSFEVRDQKESEEGAQLNARLEAIEAKRQKKRAGGGRILRAKPSPEHFQPTPPTSSLQISELDEAIALLQKKGIDPNQVQLAPSEHRMRPKDTQAALLFGGLGALLPSLGSNVFQEIQRAADGRRLPGLLQSVFGRHPAPFLDMSQGRYHRFDKNGSHDLLTALPTGIQKLGPVSGLLQVLQHLLTDSFGATGIPLPGSSALAEFIDPKTLSRYAALRMIDGVATGTTSLLLEQYFQKEGVGKDSMRQPLTALVAHGTCVLATLASTAILGLGTSGSHLNWISAGAVVKNYARIREITTQLKASNEEQFQSWLAELDGL